MHYLTLRRIEKANWEKFSNECFINERAVEGFVTISIPQTPPKNCVLNIAQRVSNDVLQHLGYATCVSLLNGENGLLTSHHLLTAVDDVCVQSFRNGKAMDIDDRFKILYVDKKKDLVILTGPQGWESALACGSVPMITRGSLCQGNTRHFKNKDGWIESNAKFIGDYEDYLVMVMSNTEAGDSGAPYFVGKCVAGVHKGHTGRKEDNFNLASPIPNIPGITSSKLVFETSAPMGKIFREEDYELPVKQKKAVYKGKGQWILVEDGVYLDGLVDTETSNKFLFSNEAAPSAPPLYPEVEPYVLAYPIVDPFEDEVNEEISGNESSSTACLKTGKSEPTPMKSSAEMLLEKDGSPTEKLLAMLAERVDMNLVHELLAKELKNKAKVQPPRKRGKRGGKKPQKISENILPTSTTGQEKYKAPHLRKSQVSASVAPSPSSITPNKKEKPNGVGKSRSDTQSWRVKPQGLAGQGSGQKQS